MMNKNLLRQAQQMQARLAKAQEELGKATVEASAGGGAVKVVVTGHQQLLSVKISPEAVDPEDVEMLEDLVLAAVNEGMEKARELASSQLGAITGGLNIPGLM
jgi:DNA-binding YbaB/EbfC family protein